MNIIRWNGEPISAPGIYSGVPIDTYHEQLTVEPSVSSSGLRRIFSDSPAHYFADSYLNPEREEQKSNEALILGRGAHHLLLGEADFSRHFAIRPPELNGAPWNSNRTDCKQWLNMCRDQGLTVLLAGQIEAIRGMARSLAQHPMVRAGILNGLIEHSITWKDRETGVWLKVRPDAIPTDSADFGDFKTTLSVGREALERTVADYGYIVQAALAGMASREVIGREMNSFSLIFAEKTPPYCVRVVTLKPADIELGERIARQALRTFADCLDTGVWPGPGGVQSDAEFIEIPSWSRSRFEARLNLLEQGVAA